MRLKPMAHTPCPLARLLGGSAAILGSLLGPLAVARAGVYAHRTHTESRR